MIVIYGVVVSLAVVFLVLLVWPFAKLYFTGKRVERELKETKVARFDKPGSIKRLSVLPLVEYYGENSGLKTEAGVSYFIQADEIKILMDTGANEKAEHPSPLVCNMEKLNCSHDALDFIFLSHIHRDHIGGARDERARSFSISEGHITLPPIPVYAPEKIRCSGFNRGPVPETVSGPVKIKEGIVNLGPIPRSLFLLGYTLEHSLAFNVEGKGIVLVIGCGHPTIEKILERTGELFKEPLHGIIGGLHLPVNGGRMNRGPFNIQKLVGSHRPPWKGLNETDVHKTIATIKRANPAFIALSPHDSSDWTIEQFRRAFGEKYHDIKVGKKLTL